MNTGPDAAKPSSGIRSLLLRRWDFSSRAVALLTLLFFVAINLPGNNSRHVSDSKYNTVLIQRYEHGWPFSHIVRRERWSPPEAGMMPGMPQNLFPSAEPTVLECWQFWELEEQGEFYPYCLLGNVVIGLAVSLISAGLFEVWRRRRLSLFQFHLIDVGLAVTAIAGALGWYVSVRSIHDREQAALNAYVDEMTENGMIRYTMSETVTKEKRGPTWLRLCLGDRYFEVLDRVVEASPLRGQGIASLASFRELRKTHVKCRDLNELSQVGQFRQLESLDLTLRIRKEAGSDDTILVPTLPNLRRLTIQSLENRPAGLDKLISLRGVNLQAAHINTETLRELGRLPNLRELSLSAGDLPSESFQALLSLAELESLDLEGAEGTNVDHTWVSKLPALKNLSLNSQLTEEWLKLIARCQSLESLSMEDLTEEQFRVLAKSPCLRQIFVTYPSYRNRFASPNSDRRIPSWPPRVDGWEIQSLGDVQFFFFRTDKQTAIE